MAAVHCKDSYWQAFSTAEYASALLALLENAHYRAAPEPKLAQICCPALEYALQIQPEHQAVFEEVCGPNQ
jgi:hypothetical protein